MLARRAGALWAGRPLRVPLGGADAARAGFAQGGCGFVQQPRHGSIQGAKSAEGGQACGSRQPGHGPPSELGAGLGQPEQGPLLAASTGTTFRGWSGRRLSALSAGIVSATWAGGTFRRQGRTGTATTRPAPSSQHRVCPIRSATWERSGAYQNLLELEAYTSTIRLNSGQRN